MAQDSEGDGVIHNMMATWKLACLSLFGLFIYYCIGCGYYGTVEHWDITDCIYFVTVSISTIGYGQFIPTTDSSRVFTSFFVPFGIVYVFAISKSFAENSLVHLQARALEAMLGRSGVTQRNRVIFSVACIIVLFFIGLISYSVLEDWTAARAFYWTMCTMTTVGYGDLQVTKESTRRFGIFFIVCCFLIFSTAVDNVQGLYNQKRKDDELELVTRDSMGKGPSDSIPSAFPVTAKNASGERESERIIAHLLKNKVISKADLDAAQVFVREGNKMPVMKFDDDDNVL